MISPNNHVQQVNAKIIRSLCVCTRSANDFKFFFSQAHVQRELRPHVHRRRGQLCQRLPPSRRQPARDRLLVEFSPGGQQSGRKVGY